jgi:hypothetical protein
MNSQYALIAEPWQELLEVAVRVERFSPPATGVSPKAIAAVGRGSPHFEVKDATKVISKSAVRCS